MTPTTCLIALSLMLVAVALAFAAEDHGEGEAGTYRLVWSDEFETDGRPDPAKWTYEHGFVRNRELQWYQPDNAFVADGKLIIEGRRERRPNPNHEPDSENWKQNRPFIEYTSACVTTRGLHAWQYGRFEVRARIRAEAGLWPAIWFLGVDGGWPHNGEIDLMEYYKGTLLANAFWGRESRWDPRGDVTRTPIASFDDPGWDERFHVWRMDWDERRIALYVDDQLLNTIDLTKAVNAVETWGPRKPFQQPHFLLLNLAIGSNGGDPSHTEFPTRYEIDYVRIYQRTE